MWQWLHDLSPGQATFLGSVTGLIALLLGALFNAHLNRRRDDRLRREDQRVVATALKAELAGFSDALRSNVESLKDPGTGDLLTPDLAQSVLIMSHMAPKFGLLDQETIQSVIAAYIVVAQYCERLLLLGGHLREDLIADTGRRLVALPADKARLLIAINTSILRVIQDAIAKLDASLGSISWWRWLRSTG
jgi:hypothetical protein